MAIIDNQLAESQDFIGATTNTAQLIMSNAWDAKRKGKDVSAMWEKLDALTVLSGLCIDLAKRIPDVDIPTQIAEAKKTEEMLKYKPYWWMVRNKDTAKKGKKVAKEMKKKNLSAYQCPMDYLYDICNNIPQADRISNVEIMDLIQRGSAGKANNSQKHLIEDIIDNYLESIKHSFVKQVSDKEEKKRLYLERKDILDSAVEELTTKKIRRDTMYAIIKNILQSDIDNGKIRSLNVLYKAQPEKFLDCFQKK